MGERRSGLLRFPEHPGVASNWSRPSGPHGVEPALLAAEPNHVLWTDDVPLGMVASGEFGAARVWTQPALHHRHATEPLDRDVLAEADARLIGWNYVATRFDAATIARAGRLAGWDAGRWPFRIDY